MKLKMNTIHAMSTIPKKIEYRSLSEATSPERHDSGFGNEIRLARH